jgi:hypothetical protein
MRRKYVLIPHAIAERCTLLEAVYWIAFNRYPIHEYSEEAADRREDTECNDGVRLEEPLDIESFFTKEICDKYGLPISPVAEYINENGEYPYLGGFSDDIVARLVERGDFDQEAVKKNLEDRRKQEELDKEQSIFEDALLSFLEIHKAELFAALRKGLVKAYGRNLLKHANLSDFDFSDGIEISDLWASGIEPPLEEISPQDWYANSIDWEECHLVHNTKSAICHILVDVESLFYNFPEPTPQIKSVMSVNGVLVDYEGNYGVGLINPNKAGRPSYDWKSFQAEMASRLLNGSLPKLQKTCVIEMHEWCMHTWKDAPSETNLKNHISPFYAALKKSENK